MASETGKAYRSERNGVQIEALDAIEPESFFTRMSTCPFSRRKPSGKYSKPFDRILSISRTIIPSAVMQPLLPTGWGLRALGTNHFMPENLAPYVPVLSRIKPVFNWVLWRWMRETYDRVDALACPSRTAASILPRSACGRRSSHLLRGEYHRLPYRSIQ